MRAPPCGADSPEEYSEYSRSQSLHWGLLLFLLSPVILFSAVGRHFLWKHPSLSRAYAS